MGRHNSGIVLYVFHKCIPRRIESKKRKKKKHGTVSFLSTLVLGLGFYVQFNFNRGSSTTLAACIKAGHEFALPPIVKGY